MYQPLGIASKLGPGYLYILQICEALPLPECFNHGVLYSTLSGSGHAPILKL